MGITKQKLIDEAHERVAVEEAEEDALHAVDDAIRMLRKSSFFLQPLGVMRVACELAAEKVFEPDVCAEALKVVLEGMDK